jgi:hypothetical protein
MRPIAAARGWFLWVRSEATVRAAKEEVNTQELCNGEILFPGLKRRSTDQGKVEYISQEVLSTGIS